MPLNWIKDTNNNWCNLLHLDLNQNHFNNLEGVYIIWHTGAPSWTVRVGQGVIRDRLSDHRQNPEILIYQNLGLSVTWIPLRSDLMDGVENYLFDTLKPLVGERRPNVEPIPIDLPW